MTAGRSPVELLDALDALQAAEHETLPWRLDHLDSHHVQDRHGNGVTNTYLLSDAALIVAAVNHLPALVAALRAVWALCDGADERVRGSIPPTAAERLIAEGLHQVRVGALRAAVTAALTEGGQA